MQDTELKFVVTNTLIVRDIQQTDDKPEVVASPPRETFLASF